MLTLLSLPGGLSRTAPTRVGALTAVDGGLDRRPRVLLLVRVQVGGVLRPDDHIGLRPGPCRDLGRQLRGALRMQIEHRRALGVEVQPGGRHVALHAGDLDRAAAGRQWHEQPAGHDRHSPDRDGRTDGRPAQVGRRRSEQPAGQGHGEGHQGGSAEGGQVQGGRVCLREGQPRPREAAVRRAVPQCLLRDPEPGDGQRREAGAPGRGQGQAQQREVQRLQDGEGHPREGADVDPAPVQQRHEVAEPGQQAEQGADPGPAPARRDGEQRDPDRGQRPDVVVREREPETQPAEDAQRCGVPERDRVCRPTLGSPRGSAGASALHEATCRGWTRTGPRCRWGHRCPRWVRGRPALSTERAGPSVVHHRPAPDVAGGSQETWMARRLRAQTAPGPSCSPHHVRSNPGVRHGRQRRNLPSSPRGVSSVL